MLKKSKFVKRRAAVRMRHYSFRLSTDLVARIDKASEHYSCSRNELIRVLLPEALNELDKEIEKERALLAKRKMGEGRAK